MGNGRGLESVEFVEDAVEGCVGDEMVDVVVVGCGAGLFGEEGGRAGEGVVDGAD